MIKTILITLFCVPLLCFGQQELIDTTSFDGGLLMKYSVGYLNAERRKKKVGLVLIDESLKEVAEDHSAYMASNKFVGHQQKSKSRLLRILDSKRICGRLRIGCRWEI